MSIRYLLAICFIWMPYSDQSSFQNNTLPASFLLPALQKIRLDNRITADSAYRELSNWNRYPSISSVGRQSLFSFYDSIFGEIPFRVFVPESYKSTNRNPLLLLLHGAVGLSSFNDARNYLDPSSSAARDNAEDPLFNFFSKRGYIIVMPIADSKKKFDWSINKFEGFAGVEPVTNNGVNATYKTLSRMVSLVKASLNIDDDRVFAMGHSDGADGTFVLGLTQPSQFAAFAIYNSMLTNLAAHNIYLKNLKNISLYAVHSDLDDLRPIQGTREILTEANQFLDRKIIYKEYHGYRHFDKHLTIDVPYAAAFFEGIERDSYPADIYWESENSADNRCAWIAVDKFDVNMPKADWQTEFNPKAYNKMSGDFGPGKCYDDNNESYAIRGHYSNNTFTIFTSRVKSFNIYIDPSRVNISLPVEILVNGKRVFDGLVPPDKGFLLGNFGENFDRKALWIAKVRINVPLA